MTNKFETSFQQLENIMVKDLQKLADLKKTVQKEAHKTLKQCLGSFTDTYPDIKGIYWIQYTPYFNDGDECIFGLHGFYATKKQSDIDNNIDAYDDDDTGWVEVYNYGTNTEAKKGYTPEEWKALCKLQETLENLEDTLKAGFGDHVKVIVSNKGVEIEEYEHE